MEMDGDTLRLMVPNGNSRYAYLIHTCDYNQGMIVTQEGSLIDLDGKAVWLTIQEYESNFKKRYGIVVFEGGKLFFWEAHAETLEKNRANRKAFKNFCELEKISPEVSYFQLQERLLNDLKIKKGNSK